MITNTIKYSYDEEGRARSRSSSRSMEKITIEIIDDGHDFDPFHQTPPDLSLPPHRGRPIGNFDLHLVKNTMDEYLHLPRKREKHRPPLQEPCASRIGRAPNRNSQKIGVAPCFLALSKVMGHEDALLIVLISSPPLSMLGLSRSLPICRHSGDRIAIFRVESRRAAVAHSLRLRLYNH